MNAYYFGCYSSVHGGHGFHRPGGKSIRATDDGPVRSWACGIGPWDQVDGTLAPVVGERRGYRKIECPQGVAALHHKDGWTALAFWDRTGDHRGNSHSNFFFDEILDFDAAVAAARVAFPELFERFDFEIVPVATSGARQ